MRLLATRFSSLRPCHALPLGSILHHLADEGWTGPEVADAIDRGCELCYFKLKDDSPFLTEAGYEAMREPPEDE